MGQRAIMNLVKKGGGDQQKKAGETPISISGIVVPVNWDEGGRVVAVALLANTEDEYLINENYKGRELLHHMREEVEVRGVARENHGKRMITVQKYKLKRA